jgi:hypothetical protein
MGSGAWKQLANSILKILKKLKVMTVQQNFYLNIFEEQIDYFTLKMKP